MARSQPAQYLGVRILGFLKQRAFALPDSEDSKFPGYLWLGIPIHLIWILTIANAITGVVKEHRSLYVVGVGLIVYAIVAFLVLVYRDSRSKTADSERRASE